MSRLVRLYPGPWRERYEAEFLQLIEDRPPSPMERLDIIRGALDARLHPQVVEAAPEPMPWTHRLPGLLSLSAGLALCLAVLGISFGPGPDWGAAASFLGIAVILMPISLPGDYLGSQRRRLVLVGGAFGGSLAAANVLGWGVAAQVLGTLATLVAICGLLATAALRAGIAPRGRWIAVVGGVLLPLILVAGITLVRETTGVTIVDVTASTTALFALPYGLAWLIVGLRMAVRGSPTIVDRPTVPSAAGRSGAAEVTQP
ncbi:MAG TPA: hypothetical protein VN773_12820 [Verrucomicrobiae bacterium]|jgi:hypothetical protein|nr:hypothetical protein [Verrucomicrobiae bacterium]